ncbi:M16 family metallopeptidase [Sediminibacterium goheungense]|uniref:Putative Zn-dependent peptidase n=1 Tax=Sediminibacterium goheungense TaxID=1086393 RepID=A0A4R6IUZ9_9BACT|nr:pitrilysin family protein [Sediminibacterium goheungense]TDO26459.1 putative Zn-dependent peptidase [Sediminibacterium goheungense]
MINRKTAPAITDAVSFNLSLKPCERYVLDNKTPVYAIHAGAQDVVMVEWVFYAGNWYESKNIVAGTTNFLLKNGTQKRNAYSINEYFEFYGAYLNRSCYNETATITLHCLTKHLHELLPVVAEIITESIFPEEELAICKQNQKQRLQVNLKKCDFVANRLIDEYVFGFHHPYGKYTSTIDYDALQREELKAFHEQFYKNGTCMVFAAGKLPANLDQQLNQVFGKLPLNSQPLPDMQYPVVSAVEKKYRIMNDAEGVQGAIRLAQPFFNRHHPDFPKVQVLNNIFGGFFGSRLMSNIREDKGYTYGIHSYLQNHIHQSAWMISTEAGRDVCEATIAEVYHEMERLRNEPIGKEELDLVRNYMMGSLLGDLDGPFQIIGRWKTYILNGLDEQYFYKSIETIRTVSSDELQILAKQYLNPEHFYELVVV